MAQIMNTESGIRFYVSEVIDHEENTGNVMVSIPETQYDMVWTMADYLKVGPLTMPIKNGRFATSFKDVDTRYVRFLVRHLNYVSHGDSFPA